MLAIRKTALTLAALVFAPTVWGAEPPASCETKEFDSIYIYVQEVAKSRAEMVKLYEAYTTNLEALAEEADIKNFSIVSRDLSVHKSSFGENKVDGNISLSMQFDADYKAITAILEGAKWEGFSSQRSSWEVCEETPEEKAI